MDGNGMARHTCWKEKVGLVGRWTQMVWNVLHVIWSLFFQHTNFFLSSSQPSVTTYHHRHIINVEVGSSFLWFMLTSYNTIEFLSCKSNEKTLCERMSSHFMFWKEDAYAMLLNSFICCWVWKKCQVLSPSLRLIEFYWAFEKYKSQRLDECFCVVDEWIVLKKWMGFCTTKCHNRVRVLDI